MAKAAQALSAKDFRDPLLKVLATHTKFDSGRTAKAEDLYGPVCKMMGVNHEDYGYSGEVLWVQKWIQWAFQALREEGLGVKHGRGTWGLTPDGVDKARSMMATATQNSTDEADVDALATIIAAMPEVVTVTDDGTYHPDPYIRTVALSDHKCMGFFTDQSPVCVTCPARVLCHRHMLTKLSAMATELDEADIFAAKVAAKQAQAAAVPDAGIYSNVIDPAAEPDRYHPPADALIIEQTCSGTVVCDHCGGMINDGEASVWVRKVGPMKNKSLMLHRECCVR